MSLPRDMERDLRALPAERGLLQLKPLLRSITPPTLSSRRGSSSRTSR